MKQVLALLAAAAMLSACSSREDRVRFDGQYFRAKAKRIDGNFDQFTVTVKPVSASLAGAREAAKYEATIYCVNNFGTSEIEWVINPDSDVAAQSIQNDTLVFQGVCPST